MARGSYEAGLKIRRKMLGGPWCRAKGPGLSGEALVKQGASAGVPGPEAFAARSVGVALQASFSIFQHLCPRICCSLQYLVA